jgi:hypothetical protein
LISFEVGPVRADGAQNDGTLRPDLSRTGMGLEFKHAEAAAYVI